MLIADEYNERKWQINLRSKSKPVTSSQSDDLGVNDIQAHSLPLESFVLDVIFSRSYSSMLLLKRMMYFKAL